jgi:putative flippase GtrA
MENKESGVNNKTKSTFVQFIKFGLVGVSNTVVSYVIYAITYAITKNYVAGNVVSWLISVLNAYLWQNIFVFKQDQNREKRVWWKVLLKTYAAYAFTGLFLNNLVSWLLIDVIGIARYCGGLVALLAEHGMVMSNDDCAGYAAPFFNLLMAIPINFAINKFWAYKQK